jgi:hypothetical protein
MSGTKQDELPGVTPPTPEAKPNTGASDIMAAMSKRLEAYEAAEAQRAAAQKDADKKAAEKAQADGDLRAQLELAKKQLSQFEALAPDAELGKRYREREQQRIDKALEGMTPEQRELVEAQPTVDMKSRMVDFIGGTKTTTNASPKPGEQKRDPPKAGAPAGDAIDFKEAFKDPVKWAEAKRLDPEGAKAAIKATYSSTQRRPLAFLNTNNSQGH